METNLLDIVNFLACVAAALAAIYLGQMMLVSKDDSPFWIHAQRLMLAVIAAMFMVNALQPQLESHPPSPLKTALVFTMFIWFALRAGLRHRDYARYEAVQRGG